MTSNALGRTSRPVVILLSLLAVATAARAQLACNAPAQGFGTGIPAGWTLVDNAGNGIAWGDLASCGEAGNYTGGAGGAACVSSDLAGRGDFDAELRSPVFNLAGATSASLDFNASYQNFAGSDFLDVDISTNGGTSWTTLVRWNEDHGAFRSTPGEFARIDLSPFLGMSNLRLRWRYYDPNAGDWDWYAQLDDVKLTCPVCSGTQHPDPTVDGGFEAGSPSAAWAEASTNFGTPLCSPATCGFSGARSGSWWAFFGGTAGTSETASLEQTVVISPGTANLTFFLWNPESSGNGTDALRVRVDGTQVLSIPAGNSLYAAGYTRVVVNLSAFANGGAHTIRFETTTSGAPSNSNFFVDDVSLSICEPPPTALTVDDVSVTEGSSGTTNLTFTVTLAPTSAQTVTVDYATANGTATAGADYTTTSGTLTFLSGETTKTVTVPVVGDTLDEDDETLTLNLSNAVNASIADGQGTGTIVDDDASAIAINDVTVAEGNSGTTSATFTVSLSNPSSHTITVDYATANGTATAGSDYVAASGTVTFAPGETSKTLAVTVNGDTVDEPDETFVVNLSNATNASIADAQGVGTIQGADPVTIAINDVTVAEGNSGTTPATFTVSLSNASSSNVTVTYQTANGTATAGSDYVAVAVTVLTFAPGETSKTVSVAVNGDTVDEPDETFVVNLSNATNASIADTQGVGTIQGADPVTIAINDVTVAEGNSGTTPATFTVSLSNASSSNITVTWQTANGTATAGSDYVAVAATVLTFLPGETSKTISVTVNGDTVDEPDETFVVNLSSPTNATLADAQGVGTIQGGDPVTIAINDVTVAEGNSGTTLATFTVSLSNASSNAVTVTYQTADGTATAPSDYVAVAATVLTFAAGETSKTVSVTVNGDTVDEPNETFNVNLTSPTNATIADAQGVGTIQGADPVTIAINDVTVAEGNSGTTPATFTVSLSNASSSNVTVTWQTANGTATAGSDYVAVAATVLTFLPGETSKTISVTVNGDTVDEPNETFNVNLTSPTNATIADAQGVGTIQGADPVTIAINDVTVAEGNSGTVCATFTVSLSNASSSNVTVTWQTANGTATAPSDYVAVAATVITFLPGETTKTICVTVNGDTLDEPNETFNVNLTSPTNATIADAQGVGTIQGADPVTIAINDVTVAEGNSGTTPATFTVSLSNVSSSNVTVTWQTANGTATAGSDYVAVAATVLTFLPGETSKTVSVTVNGDTVDEANETFFVNLTNPTNATIADAQGVGTIQGADPVTIAINDVQKLEGQSGTSTLTFTVSLSNASSNNVTVTWQTANNTATAPSDYVAVAATVLTFTPGQTSRTVDVIINGDTTTEPNETFFVNLTSPTNATIGDAQGIGTILNDDTPNVILPADFSATEGDTEAPTPDPTVTVTLSNAASQTVTVNYATANGTAVSGIDYTATSGTLTFNPGETTKSFTLPLVRDKRPEQTERLFLNFSGASGGNLPADTQVDVTILDDDHVYSLYGNADSTTVPGCFDMADVFFEKGAAYASKPFSLTHKLDMTFRVFFGKYDNGGGGLVWLLAPSHMLGNDDMGYGFVSPSVGVEMDTVNNFVNDPVEDHVAVDQNGATPTHSGAPPVQASPTSANIEDNLEHELRITRDPAINRLDVYFDGSLRLTYFKDVISQIFGGNSTVYWGFTGANNCNDSVCPNNLLYWCPVALCIGDTATPHVLVKDIQVSEGNTGNQTATFKVNLYCPRNEVVNVNWATANGTATAGADYQSAGGTLVFNPGETQKTVTVTVFQDSTSEADETFTLNLSSPSANLATPDVQAVATIIDDVRFGFGQAGDIPVMGDWNGDGIDTPGVFRNGTFFLRNSNTAGPADIQLNLGGTGDIPVAGDWNNDGIDTVGVWNGAFFFLKTANTTAASTINVTLGQSGDVPLAGDWNGDGVDTVGVRRGATFILSNTFTGTWDLVFVYGLATDVPVTGDWNNDNVDTPGVFRDGSFFLRNSNAAGVGEITINYGNIQDKPLAADVDGDGDDTVGFFRSGIFFLRK